MTLQVSDMALTRHAVRGETYAVTDTGGDGPVVLLMHGWPDERTIWRYQIPALHAAGFRVVAVDWIGHGDSSIPTSKRRYRIPEVGRDLDALLDALGVQKCHLIAHDYGATVCWEFAANFGHRLHSYCAISVGPSIEILVDILKGHPLHYHWLILHGMDRLSRWVYLRKDKRRFRSKFGSHVDAERLLGRLQSGQDQTFWTIWEKANPAYDVTLRWLLFGRRKKITVPTLGLYSTDDEWMTRGQMQRAGRHIDAAWHFKTMECGHWLQLERPEETNDLLLGWLATQR
ncbi:alpha/beta hydrolase [uncultured Tateyamaria sp.]|uniref:alpha/beta fold hydrolase n=1 Tax=uncultured Tateyamaria sp. TaxID=455651 RepID=UPI00260A1444|nr:alpha/beta hydrolase [uncultured Tateyamaria sp.]